MRLLGHVAPWFAPESVSPGFYGCCEAFCNCIIDDAFSKSAPYQFGCAVEHRDGICGSDCLRHLINKHGFALRVPDPHKKGVVGRQADTVTEIDKISVDERLKLEEDEVTTTNHLPGFAGHGPPFEAGFVFLDDSRKQITLSRATLSPVQAQNVNEARTQPIAPSHQSIIV